MAITILGQPTSPNATDTKLVYSLSSTNVTNPQFQFVTDIYSGSTKLTRLFTYPNPAGSGIVEVSNILADNLEYDNDWQIFTSTLADSSFKDFKLAFSESFGSSISSSTNVQSGNASDTITVFPGTVDPNQGSFNFADSGSTMWMSNAEGSIASQDDYYTLPILAQSGSTTVRFTYSLADGTPIGSFADTILTSTPQIKNYGIGRNSVGDSLWTNANTSYVLAEISGGPSKIITIDNGCNDEGITFSFINKYGFYDYHRFNNPVKRVTEVERNIYDKPNVDYSSTVSTYNIEDRGETQYNTRYTDRYEVTTGYLDKPTADWLTELLDSPEVFVREGKDIIPVVIENTDYTWNMNQARQKLFQFTIQFRYANKRYDR